MTQQPANLRGWQGKDPERFQGQQQAAMTGKDTSV